MQLVWNVNTKLIWIVFILAVACGCSSTQNAHTWNARQLARQNSPTVSLVDKDGEVAAVLDTRAAKEIVLAHLRVTRAAGVQAELFFMEGDDPNAHAGHVRQGRYSRYGGMPIIALNVGMLKLLENDTDAVAAVLGHEAAHLARNHGAERQRREMAVNAMTTLIELGAALGGLPVGGFGHMASMYLIDAPYSRDEEREADDLGLDYMIAAGYDPMGAIRLEEKLLDDVNAARAVGEVLPFLSTHPASSERLENMIDRINEKGYYVPPEYLASTTDEDRLPTTAANQSAGPESEKANEQVDYE